MSFRTSSGGGGVERGGNLVIFGVRSAFFKGQTFTAHGRGGLVTLLCQSNQRHSPVIRNASFRTVPPHNQAKPRAAAFFLHLSFALGHRFRKSCYAPAPALPTIVLPDFGRSCSADRTSPTLFYLCPCEEQARDCGLAATWQSQGIPLGRHLSHP